MEFRAPAHAGEYKVVSEAVHSYDGDGNPVPYAPGEAVFKVTPRALDPLKPDPGAPPRDPASPSDGSADGRGVPLRSFAKVYDGTDALGVTSASLADLVGAGPDVRLAWDSASFDGADASDARTVAFEGVRLEGADAGDYDIAATAPDGSMEVPGRIVPRELVVTAAATVASGAEGEPLRDAAGSPVAYGHDLDVWPGSGPWARNMLAPRDGEARADGSVDSVLGAAALSCLRADGLPLDGESSAAGAYEVAVSFANLPAASASAAAAPPSLKDPANKDPEVVVDEKVTVPLDPDGKPMDKDTVVADIEDRFGDRPEFPEGTVQVTITRDGEEVDAVDPRVPGTYVVTSVYTDADGTRRVVRVTYIVEAPEGPAAALRRLARTGDALPLAIPLAVAALAGALALASRRRGLV